MVLQPTGVWKYHKNLLIIENSLTLVLSSKLYQRIGDYTLSQIGH